MAEFKYEYIQEKVVSSLKYKMSSKSVLLIANFMFMLSGIVLVEVGYAIPESYEKYAWFLSPYYFSLPFFLVDIGIATIILAAILGTIAVLKDNCFMRILFVTSMVIMFTLQVYASSALFALRDDSMLSILHSMSDSISSYSNPWVTMKWDNLQRDLGCCGIHGASDWIDQLNTQETQGLPLSCCPIPYGAVYTFNCTPSTAFSQACFVAFPRFIMAQVWTLGLTVAILAGIQVLIIICAIKAIRTARAEKIAAESLPMQEKSKLSYNTIS